MLLEDIQDVDQLKRINQALMNRVESSMDQHGNAFSLFQTAISLEGQIKRRTDELTVAMRRLERINSELEAAKEDSERANLSKTKFLAAASHDVLQPLNAALLSVSVLADLQETEQGRSLAAQIEHSLDSMSELLATLLDISKLDAGVVEPREEPISLKRLFNGLQSDFGPIAIEKSLVLRFRDAGLSVTSDKTMLRRVLQNLISNALRYTETGGVLIGARKRTGNVSIEIIDTGRGIPTDQMQHVFEEFHRGALPTGHDRRANSGMGLGLSIVKRMSRALEHNLDVDSEVGKGTRFRLKVPLSISELETSSDKMKSAHNLGNAPLAGTQILLIENDPASAQAIETLFESWGCTVKFAATTAEVMGKLGDTDWLPDIIVADQHLDRGDLGSMAIQEARRYTGKQFPALVITADPSKTLEKSLQDQSMEMMKKPIKPAQLRAMVSHILSGKN